MERTSSISNESSSLELTFDSLSTDAYEEDRFDSNEHLETLYEQTERQSSRRNSSDHTLQLFHIESKLNECINQNTITHSKLDKLGKVLELFIHKLGMDDVASSVKEETSNDSALSPKNLSSLDIIDNKVTECISSNKIFHSKIDIFQKNMEFILENVDNVMMMSETFCEKLVGRQNLSVYRFPIASINELNRLDEELEHNEYLMSNLVEKFCKIAGNCGDKSGNKVGVKIIEEMIAPKLLTKFTWHGEPHGSHNTKYPFMTYSSIFYLFLQVMSKADRSFDSNTCENFLKNNIFKHSAMRLSRKLNKRIRRVPAKPESSRGTKLFIDKSDAQSSSRSNSVYLNRPQHNSDTEGEIEEAKANLKNIIAIKKETEKNRGFSSTSSIPKKCDHDCEIEKLDRKISLCVESNENLHLKIDKLQETLDIVLRNIGCSPEIAREPPAPPSSIVSETVEEDELDTFYFPITSNTELRDFNKKLSLSENFEEKMIDKFVSTAEKVKRASLQRYGIAVVESIIAPQLLLKYSWTGRSRTLERKMAFMKFKYVVNLFHKIISTVDNQFTRKECENFLRFTVFKYISFRLERTKRKVKVSPRLNVSEQNSDDDDIQEFHTTCRISALSLVPNNSPEVKSPPRKSEDHSARRSTEV